MVPSVSLAIWELRINLDVVEKKLSQRKGMMIIKRNLGFISEIVFNLTPYDSLLTKLRANC